MFSKEGPGNNLIGGGININYPGKDNINEKANSTQNNNNYQPNNAQKNNQYQNNNYHNSNNTNNNYNKPPYQHSS
jgi:hypothetical protein